MNCSSPNARCKPRTIKRARRPPTWTRAGCAPATRGPCLPRAGRCRLLTRVVDLYDSEAVDLLSDEVGSVAVDAARRWTELLPHGGTVILTDSGAGVALLGATWTYLGSLDSE